MAIGSESGVGSRGNVELSFLPNLAEITFSRSADINLLSPAALTDSALEFETRFVVNGVDAFAGPARDETVLLVGPDGSPAGGDVHPVSRNIAVPLFDVMVAGREALGHALTSGRGAWTVAGGSERFIFERLDDGLRVSWARGTRMQHANAADLEIAFEDFRRSVREFLRMHLPDLLDHPVWSSVARAYDLR